MMLVAPSQVRLIELWWDDDGGRRGCIPVIMNSGSDRVRTYGPAFFPSTAFTSHCRCKTWQVWFPYVFSAFSDGWVVCCLCWKMICVWPPAVFFHPICLKSICHSNSVEETQKRRPYGTCGEKDGLQWLHHFTKVLVLSHENQTTFSKQVNKKPWIIRGVHKSRKVFLPAYTESWTKYWPHFFIRGRCVPEEQVD